MEQLDIAQLVSQYGFPIIAAVGLGYFIYYIWQWVTEKVDPVIEESHMTLIGLIDKVRMLDNDLLLHGILAWAFNCICTFTVYPSLGLQFHMHFYRAS